MARPASTSRVPASPREPERAQPRAARLIGAAVFVLAFAAFLPALRAGFSDFDDYGVLQVDTRYQGFALENLRWMFTTTHMGHYQPLTWLSYAVDYSVWGLDPAAFHFTNLLLHAVNAVLVYCLALALLGRRDNAPDTPAPPPRARLARELGAGAAALLFAVHPLRVESVAWVTERRDVLSTCVLLLATLAYLRSVPRARTSTDHHTQARARFLWYVVSLALLLCSLLSKAWGMTFFVAILVIDWYPLRRLPQSPLHWWRPPALRVLLEKVPFALLGVAFAFQAAAAQSSVPSAVVPLAEWPIPARAAQGAYGIAFYLWKLLWPADLAALYELPRSFIAGELRWTIGYIVTAALLVAAVGLRRRAPAFTAAAVAYIVLVSPVLGVFQSGIQLVADRYSYVANIPWALLAGAGMLSLATRARPPLFRIAAAASSIALGVLFAATWKQTYYWRDTEALFAYALATGQDGPRVHENYGQQLFIRGRKEEALRHFDAAIERWPNFPDAWFSRAQALRDLGLLSDAEFAFKRAAQLMPDAWRADYMLGVMYAERLGRKAEAKSSFESALRRLQHSPPPTGQPFLLLAQAFDEMGDPATCWRLLQAAAGYKDTSDEAVQHLQEMAR